MNIIKYIVWPSLNILTIIMKFTTAENLTSVSFSANLPQGYYLEQNYPNPFNPETVISYAIGTGQIPASKNPSERGILLPVTLKVYNMLGKEILTLINEEQPPGIYKIRFNACSYGGSNLSSGVYFYQLKTGQFIQNKKMILMR